MPTAPPESVNNNPDMVYRKLNSVGARRDGVCFTDLQPVCNLQLVQQAGDAYPYGEFPPLPTRLLLRVRGGCRVGSGKAVGCYSNFGQGTNESSGFLQVGLDAAGKTTILYKLKLGEIVTTIPTIGKLHGVRGARFRLLENLLHTLDFLRTCGSCGVRHGSQPLSCRFQRGDRGVQEHQLHCVGCWWSGQGRGTCCTAISGDHKGP